jgi:hypothetical protein
MSSLVLVEFVDFGQPEQMPLKLLFDLLCLG